MLPVVIPGLPRDPFPRQKRHLPQTVEPHFTPPRPHQQRVRRTRRIGEHVGRPAEILTQQASALEMDVVGKAVGRRADGDDRLQCRRPQCRNLQRIEAAPGNPHHAGSPRAPGLAHRPVDHITRILQFLRGVFIFHHAFGITVAAHIDPDAGIALSRHPRMGQAVTHDRAIAFAVRQMLQDDRHRVVLRILRHPDPGRQPAAVGHLDRLVLDLDDLTRKPGFSLRHE
jgi:hypothetical protein